MFCMQIVFSAACAGICKEEMEIDRLGHLQSAALSFLAQSAGHKKPFHCYKEVLIRARMGFLVVKNNKLQCRIYSSDVSTLSMSSSGIT